MTEEAKTAEAAATSQVEKTPEELAKDAKKKAKKEAAAAKKAEKEAEKARKKAEEEAKKHALVKDPNDPSAAFFGETPLNRSQCDPELRFEKKYTDVQDLSAEMADSVVRVRCRVHRSRGKGNACFIVGREGYSTVQAVLFKGDNISKGMVTFASKIPRESIIELVAKVTVPENPIEGCSQ